VIVRAVRGGFRALECSFRLHLVMAALLVTTDLSVLSLVPVLRTHDRRVAIAIVLAFLLAQFALFCVVRPGPLALHAHSVHGNSAGPRIMVARMHRAPAVALAQVLRTLVPLVTALIAASPGIGFALIARGRGGSLGVTIVLALVGFVFGSVSVMLVDRLVCIEQLGALEALRETWRRSRAIRTELFLLCVVIALFELVGVALGLLLFGIGLAFTVPAMRAWTDAMVTHAYFDALSNAPKEQR
jgi:hypothetical protein